MGSEDVKDIAEIKRSKFRIALLGIICLLISLRLVDIFLYPDAALIPPDFFLAIVVAQMFFLWFDELKEKNRIIWVQKKKDELNEMKTKFTLITSHELMTPITVIKGYMELMMERLLGELTDKQKEALDVMNKYFLRLEEIKNNLTRLYSGSLSDSEKTLKPFSVKSLIDTTTADMQPFIKKRNQTLFVEAAGDIPDVNMDPNGIRQVLINLLLNAVRFTPDGGRIVVRAKDEKDRVRVEVEDSGIGIPKDKLTSIFESFYEVQDTSKHSSGTVEFKSGGMGLGLTIAKNIIDSHKGNIWAESELDRFSRFIFTIPKA